MIYFTVVNYVNFLIYLPILQGPQPSTVFPMLGSAAPNMFGSWALPGPVDCYSVFSSIVVTICVPDNLSFTQRLRVDRRLEVHNGCVSCHHHRHYYQFYAEV